MSMKFPRLVSALLTMALACWLQVIENPTASAQDSAREVLGHYEGNWNSSFTIEPQNEGESAKSFSGTVNAKWVLGNQFLEQNGRYRLDENSPPLEIKTLMRYDPATQRYLYDYFTSGGTVRQSIGEWDASTKTMTSVMKEDENGIVVTLRADFSTENTERWTIESKNAAGETVLKMIGTNTRINKPAH